MSRTRRAFTRGFPALVMLAAITVNRADAQEQPPEGRPLLTNVDLRGVTAVDGDALRRGLVTQATQCRTVFYAPICLFSKSPLFAERAYLDEAEMRRDLLRIRLFYWRRGYRDVEVTTRTQRTKNGIRAIFDIKENAPTVITTLDVVQRDSAIPRADIARLMLVKAGDPLDMVSLDSTRLLVRNLLQERGFADAQVTIDTTKVDNETNQAPIALELASGRKATVAAIDVKGNIAVSRRTVGRLMHIRPGDTYRRTAVLESQRDLYLSGLFSEVDVVTPPTTDSAKTITVSVTEAHHKLLEFRGGFTTADFGQLEAEFTRYHFLGSARRLTLRGTVSNLLAKQLNGAGIFYDVTNGAEGEDREPFLRPTWAASADLVQPWFLGPSNHLGASIFTHRRSIPGVVTDVGAGASLGFTRTLTTSSANVNYTYEASRIEASDVYFCVAVGICLASAIDVVSARHPLAPLAFVAQLDRSDNPLSPTAGVRARLDLEHASKLTASDFSYNRASFAASKYMKMGRRAVLAGRVRFGYVAATSGANRQLGVPESDDPVIHPRKLFFAGGSRSVRGYGENQLGPRLLTIDPARLTDSTLAACTPASVADGSCDPNIAGLGADAFQPRPLGGTTLGEASVEYRFPLAFAAGLTGAVFLDGAVVGTNRFSDLLGASASITPGFGVRFATPAGPVRLDLGLRPRLVENLPVVTQVTNTDGSFRLVALQTPRRYDQAEVTGGALKQILSRLTLHLAIGPAF
jgi:outer membrane protein assembly factor BamA